LIRQMLNKLIENGVSFHRPGGPIEISLSQNDDINNPHGHQSGPDYSGRITKPDL
jgi:signal transduction histidine kinase